MEVTMRNTKMIILLSICAYSILIYVSLNQSEYLKIIISNIFKNDKVSCPEPLLNKTVFANIPQTSDSQCSSPYVEVEDRGRLGNQICRYMSLWVFRKHFGTRVLIQKRTYKMMTDMFLNLTIPHRSANESCYPIEGFSVEAGFYQNIYKNFYKSMDYIRSHRIHESPFISGRNLVKYHPCETQLISNYRDELREELQFNNTVVNSVETYMRSFLAKHKYRRENITLVSVHARRTDYINYSVVHKQTLPDYQYFLQLMDDFRKRYDNVVFAVFSDDLAWCKKHLDGRDVVFPGSGEKKNPVLDFMFITLCDHHIIGPGTFSFTSAFLGRGSIVYGVADYFLKNTVLCHYLCNPFLTTVLIT